MRAASAVAVAALSAALPALAAAQLCAGTPSFREGRMRLTAGGSFNKSAKAFTFGLARGGPTVFGELGVSNVRFEDLDAAAYAFSLAAGSQFDLGRARRAQVCPIASVGYVAGPSDVDVFGDGSVLVDLRETDVTFGLAIGALANRSTDSPVIGTASLAYANSTLKAREQGSTTRSSTSESYGIAGAGLTFIFSRSIGLHTGASVPFGIDGAQASFGLAITVNFGRKSENP